MARPQVYDELAKVLKITFSADEMARVLSLAARVRDALNTNEDTTAEIDLTWLPAELLDGAHHLAELFDLADVLDDCLGMGIDLADVLDQCQDCTRAFSQRVASIREQVTKALLVIRVYDMSLWASSN